MPEPAESRSMEEATTWKRLVSVDRDPKNRSYINSDASIRNLFNNELLAGLLKLDKILKIQTDGKPIHLLQIRSKQHLMLPIST